MQGRMSEHPASLCPVPVALQACLTERRAWPPCVGSGFRSSSRPSVASGTPSLGWPSSHSLRNGTFLHSDWLVDTQLPSSGVTLSTRLLSLPPEGLPPGITNPHQSLGRQPWRVFLPALAPSMIQACVVCRLSSGMAACGRQDRPRAPWSTRWLEASLWARHPEPGASVHMCLRHRVTKDVMVTRQYSSH